VVPVIFLNNKAAGEKRFFSIAMLLTLLGTLQATTFLENTFLRMYCNFHYFTKNA
jgi:hypothetical protein